MTKKINTQIERGKVLAWSIPLKEADVEVKSLWWAYDLKLVSFKGKESSWIELLTSTKLKWLLLTKGVDGYPDKPSAFRLEFNS